MLLSPLSHLKLNKPRASRVESQHKGTEVQQSKAQGFSSTPWVPFHQELLKLFFYPTIPFCTYSTSFWSELLAALELQFNASTEWGYLKSTFYSDAIKPTHLFSLTTFICTQVKCFFINSINYNIIWIFWMYVYFLNRRDNVPEN